MRGRLWSQFAPTNWMETRETNCLDCNQELLGMCSCCQIMYLLHYKSLILTIECCSNFIIIDYTSKIVITSCGNKMYFHEIINNQSYLAYLKIYKIYIKKWKFLNLQLFKNSKVSLIFNSTISNNATFQWHSYLKKLKLYIDLLNQI